MSMFLYDPQVHLCWAAHQRLQSAAAKAGCNLNDYVETTLKRLIFASDEPIRTGKARTLSGRRQRGGGALAVMPPKNTRGQPHHPSQGPGPLDAA